jgi:hypothetical protein
MLWWKKTKDVTNKSHPGEKNGERHQDQNNVEIVRALYRMVYEYHASRHQEHSYEKKKARREALTIIGLFVAAGVAGWQGLIFRQTMNDARESAHSSHEDTIKAIVTNARAWLAPKSAVLEELPLILGQPIHFQVLYQNLGKQPALDMIPNEIVKIVRLPASKNWNDMVLPPNETCEALRSYRIGQTIYPISPVGPLAPADSYFLHMISIGIPYDGGIELGGKTIYVQGCLAYETFSERHYSSYCFYLIPRPDKPYDQWTFGICPDGGKAD